MERLPLLERTRNRDHVACRLDGLPPPTSATLQELQTLAHLLGYGLHHKAVRALGKHLPYGRWSLMDGREVLFARSYKPLWQRHNGVVSVAPLDWFDIVSREYFFDDWTPKHQQYTGCLRLRAVLAGWGLL